jgi:hypothetical protein
MAEASRFLIVRHIRVGRDTGNPTIATVRLSADQASGPHLDFVADAMTLDRIAAALTEAAKDVRKRAH